MEGLTTGAIVFILLVIGAVFLFIARRILRLALKLAFATALVFVLIAGAGFGWWQGWFFSSSSSARRPAVQTNQKTNTNRPRR